jgi:hypothetical protein
MKIGKQIEIEILNLKFLTETLSIAEQSLKDGTDDLHFRLSHFRKRVLEKDRDSFDQYFFGEKTKNTQESYQENCDIILHQAQKALPVVFQKKDPWLKKIYRKIVSSTHPDKFQNFPVAALKEKYLKIYRKAVAAWSTGKDDILLVSAYETDIQVENPKALPILKQGNKQKNNRLQEIKKLLAYQWHHIPDKDKSKTLENYLKKLGYEFTAKEVEKVVNLARKRKVGSKPKNIRKLKNVK